MYQVLYRKYRPRVFSDMVGQEHITSTLSREIQTGKLSHAYLFTGSRGTGKTTCAKILSKAVNCLNPVDGNPCNECEICRGLDDGSILDVVEIDAASNNGVDNIRDIRDEINFTPANCKYRVYIIDEVHMLSIGAFNALLKTLEEPPAHVKFILATTEVHKLPVTVISRCQRFDFKRVTPEAMGKRMKYICECEGFTFDEDALTLISRISDGGMRDALSLLDQCSGHDKYITAELVCSVAGMTGKDHLFSLADAVCDGNCPRALELISELHSNSCDMERLCADMINHFRNLMIVKTVRNAEGLIVCTDEEQKQYKAQSEKFTLQNILFSINLLQQTLADIKRGVNRRIEMEMTFIKLSTPSVSTDTEALSTRIAQIERMLKSGSFVSNTASVAAEQKSETASVPTVSAPKAPAAAAETSERVQTSAQSTSSEAYQTKAPVTAEKPVANEPVPSGEQSIPWAEVLQELTTINMPMWGVLVGSSAVVQGDFVLIKSENATLNSFIRTGRNARDVKQAVYNVTGKNYRLAVHSNPAEQSAQQTAKKDPLDDLISRARTMGVSLDVK